jgi:hypothetical protein
MTVPPQSSITIIEEPGVREARWLPPSAKLMRGLAAVSIIGSLAIAAVVVVLVLRHTGPVFTPVVAGAAVALSVIDALLLYRVFRPYISPSRLLLYEDRLVVLATVVADPPGSGTAAGGKVLTLERPAVRAATLSDTENRYLRLDTDHGAYAFGFLLPPDDLITLAQMIGQWIGH